MPRTRHFLKKTDQYSIALYLDDGKTQQKIDYYDALEGEPEIIVAQKYSYGDQDNLIVRVFWDAQDNRFNTNKMFVYQYKNNQLSKTPIFENNTLLDLSTFGGNTTQIVQYLDFKSYLNDLDPNQAVNTCDYSEKIMCITQKGDEYYFYYFDSKTKTMLEQFSLKYLFDKIQYIGITGQNIFNYYANGIDSIDLTVNKDMIELNNVSKTFYCGNKKYLLVLKNDMIVKSKSLYDQILYAMKNVTLDEPITCKLSAEKSYFYNTPDDQEKTKKYIIRGDEVLITDYKGDFVLANYTNTAGIETTGWIKLADILTTGYNK